MLQYVFHRKEFDGQVVRTYFILYSLVQFGFEFLRTDSLVIGGFNVVQMTALLTAMLASCLWLWSRKGETK